MVWPAATGFFEAAAVAPARCEAREEVRHVRPDRIAAAAGIEGF